MKDFLIKLLGGFTRFEYDLLSTRFEISVASLDGRMKDQERAIERKDEEIKRLTNLFLTKTGYISSETPTSHEKREPISTRRNWGQIRNELERKDHEQYLKSVESRWAGKVQSGDSRTQSNGRSSSGLAVDLGSTGLGDGEDLDS